MDTRKAVRSSPQALPQLLGPWPDVMDLPRQQCAMATHAACAMFRGFQAIREVQERSAQEALKQHTAAAQRLEGRCTPLDVLAVQWDLMRFDTEAATAYWQQIAEATLQMQTRMAACSCELVDSSKLLESWAAFDAH
jgi:hypothetical protein